MDHAPPPPAAIVEYCNASMDIERTRRANAAEKLRLRKQIKAGKDLLLLELQERNAHCLQGRRGDVYAHRRTRTTKVQSKIDAPAVAMALSSLATTVTAHSGGSLRDVATEHVLSRLRAGEVVKEAVEVSARAPKEEAGQVAAVSEAMDKVVAEICTAQARLKEIAATETSDTAASKQQKAALEDEVCQYLSEQQYGCAHLDTTDRKWMVRSHKRRKVAKLDAKGLAPIVADSVQAVVNERGLVNSSLQRCVEEIVSPEALAAVQMRVTSAITHFYDRHTSEEERLELIER